MRKIKLNCSALISRLCAAGVALLGFSCSSDEPDDNILFMYGSPTGSFEVKGMVKDALTDTGVEARIRVTYPEADSGTYSFTEATTTETGNFTAQGSDYGALKLKVVCLPDNPALAADSVIVDAVHVKDKNNKDPWSHGHAEVTVDFNLKTH